MESNKSVQEDFTLDYLLEDDVISTRHMMIPQSQKISEVVY